MVNELAIRRRSDFLLDLSHAKNIPRIKYILQTCSKASLKFLILLLRDFIFQKIPLELNEDEKRKLKRYKNHLRRVTTLNPKNTR
jgi:hypothetical protein